MPLPRSVVPLARHVFPPRLRLANGLAALSLLVVLTAVALPVRGAATPLYPDLAVLPPRDLQLDRTDRSALRRRR
jgi:hypothetical protein